MTKLEKSVRTELHYHMPDIKGKRIRGANMLGIIPKGARGRFSSAYAKVEDGLCTDITIYVYGEARKPCHYHIEEGYVDISDPVREWFDENTCNYNYNDLVNVICDAIINAPRKGDEYDGEMITITEYAKLHGRSPVSVRQRAQRGSFKSAVKIGRDWLIREDEPYGDLRRK